METSLREAARLYEAEYTVGRAILSLAAVDADAAEGAARLEYGRQQGMAELARRLRVENYLRPDVAEKEAADILWVVTSFQTFDQLYAGRDLSAGECAERLIAMAKRSLCA